MQPPRSLRRQSNQRSLYSLSPKIKTHLMTRVINGEIEEILQASDPENQRGHYHLAGKGDLAFHRWVRDNRVFEVKALLSNEPADRQEAVEWVTMTIEDFLKDAKFYQVKYSDKITIKAVQIDGTNVELKDSKFKMTPGKRFRVTVNAPHAQVVTPHLSKGVCTLLNNDANVKDQAPEWTFSFLVNEGGEEIIAFTSAYSNTFLVKNAYLTVNVTAKT
ncbi:hypothetical protein CPB86DRAFT_190989 [Serendipita vermifera]|nr:hypothetical protein CPB86DRAFT_190989 [Serendipita vermifera]